MDDFWGVVGAFVLVTLIAIWLFIALVAFGWLTSECLGWAIDTLKEI